MYYARKPANLTKICKTYGKTVQVDSFDVLDIIMCCVSDCLSSFTEVEELEDSELYMCNNCKRRQKSTKKFWIRRLPNVSRGVTSDLGSGIRNRNTTKPIHINLSLISHSVLFLRQAFVNFFMRTVDTSGDCHGRQGVT